MDNNTNLENGNLTAGMSILLGILTWATPENVEYGLKVLVAFGSISTAIMAVRYYYFATKEKKKRLSEKSKSDE